MTETETVDCSASDADKISALDAVNGSAFDAEAILRALGPPLEWQHNRHRDGCRLWDAAYDEGTYQVLETPYLSEAGRREVYFAAWVFVSDVDEDVDPTEHRSEAAAKAACERHYLTGKWEH